MYPGTAGSACPGPPAWPAGHHLDRASDQILSRGYTCSPPRSGATIVFTSLGRNDVVSMTLTEHANFSLISTLSTYLPVCSATTQWPSQWLSGSGGRRKEIEPQRF